MNSASVPALITIDVDWAPDFMIRSVAKTLLASSVKSTWFITHRSAAVDELRSDSSMFELGIHPNFLPGSTQGQTSDEIIKHCMDLVPDATSMRTHALVQSGPLLQAIVRQSPVTVDVSLFLPGVPVVGPLIQHVIGPTLVRIPYSWEDDDEMARPEPCWDYRKFLTSPGPVIFDFHPVHIYLNSNSMDRYAALKSLKPSLSELQESDAAPYINVGAGTGSMFQALLGYMTSQTSIRIRDLVQPSTVGG
jgi:hypothetical protein